MAPLTWFETSARDRLAEAGTALFELRRTLQRELTDARRYSDPDLTPEGQRRRQGDLAEAARAKAAPQLEQLRTQVRDDSEALQRWASENRPAIGEDAAALARAWDGVKVRLDAGMNLPQILASADRGTVLAVQEFAPAWLEAAAFATSSHGLAAGEYVPPDGSGLRRQVDDRLLTITTGDEQLSVAVRREADAAVAGFEPLADHTSALIRGDSGAAEAGMTAAIEAQMGAAAAAAGLA